MSIIRFGLLIVLSVGNLCYASTVFITSTTADAGIGNYSGISGISTPEPGSGLLVGVLLALLLFQKLRLERLRLVV